MPSEMLPPIRRRLAVVVPVAAALLLAGCGGTPDEEAVAELEALIAPEDVSEDGEEAGDPEIEELRFDPETITCAPRKDSIISGSWETSAPRSEVDESSARIGLRDTTRVDEVSVKAEVRAPDGTWYEAATSLESSEWAEMVFPDDFESGPDGLEEGVYTVVWSVDGTGARTFLSCDGFEVG